MSDLTPEDRELLRDVRRRHEPTEVDRARIRAALVTSLGVGTGLTLTTAALPAAAGTSVIAKVLIAIAVAGALGGGGFVAYRAARTPQVVAVAATGSGAPAPGDRLPKVTPPPETPPELSASLSSEAAVPSTSVSATPVRAPIPTAIATPIPTASATHLPTPIPIATSTATSAPAATPNPAPTEVSPTATPPPASTVEAEMRLVGAAIDALHRGDPTRALALFDEHARSYPNGVLAEERAGERVMALCDLGRVADARAAAVDFLRAHAHAPLASRVRASCAAPTSP